jgi:hypothetical protein
MSKDTTLRDFAQGAWRMRQLGMGQTLVVVVTGEVERLVHGAVANIPVSFK